MVKKERLLALDVMRGITIAAMILVNNPGSWSAIYAPLRHAEWHGMTPTDLIYPFFMFIMGVSMYFSLSKFDGGLTRPAIGKVLRRSAAIFAVGLALQWCSYLGSGLSSWFLENEPEGTTIWGVLFPVATFRILGVLQGLALAYLFGALAAIALRWRWQPILWCSGVLLLLYIVLMHLGHGYELSQDNVIAVVDRAVLGADHMYKEYLPDGSRLPFEPEGLLSTLPRIVHVLLGALAGWIIARAKDKQEGITRLFILGTILLLSGLLMQYGDPVNKKIWSSSYTLATCGFASLFLGLLIWIIDIRKRSAWSRPLEAFGVNPLFLYVAGWILAVLLGVSFRAGEKVVSLKGLLYNDVFKPILGDYGGSLACALVLVALVWIAGWVLYRKKIYIKL